jgi:hypothetical protein
MSAVPVSRYLADFGTGTESAGHAEAGRRALGWDDVAPPATSAAGIEAAFAEGVERGKAAAQAALDAKLDEQKVLFQERLASEHQTWTREAADRLAERLTAGLRELELHISETAARVLKPFLAEALRRQMIAELTDHINLLIAKEAGITLSISGPEDLVNALRDKLAGKTCAITVVPGGETDVRVVAGESLLETRLGAWAAKIEEAAR